MTIPSHKHKPLTFLDIMLVREGWHARTKRFESELGAVRRKASFGERLPRLP